MQFFASPSAVSILAARRRLPWGVLILAESKGHLMTQAELRPAVATAIAELEFGSARK